MPRGETAHDRAIGDPVVRAHWHVVARASDLASDRPMAVSLLGEEVALWRCNGRVLAWQDLCIHRGVKLSLGAIRNGCQLQCAYHGWTYDADGKCTHIPAHPDLDPPAKAKARTFQAAESAGLIWVTLAEIPEPLPHLPEIDDAQFRKVLSGPYPVAAGVTRVIENFLDVAHLPFVHEGALGISSQAAIPDYVVEPDGRGLIARDIRVFQPNPDGLGRGYPASPSAASELSSHPRCAPKTGGGPLRLPFQKVRDTIGVPALNQQVD
jgi:phenylpropionate dioxygenase-like ring-hydroxylating dioxygenase large terminal subunit